MTQATLVSEVSSRTWDGEVLKSAVPVFVDFWAEWCGPCRWVAPIVEELARDYNGRMKFVKLNVDDSPGTASEYKVMAIPTLIIFENGQIHTTFVGAASKDHYVKMINTILGGSR